MSIIPIVLTFLFLGFSSLLQAQTVYTCGDDYRPIDLTFDAEGTLYSSSKEKNPIFNIEEFSLPEEVKVNGSIYRHDATGCKAIAEDWWNPYGLTTTAEGHICATHASKEKGRLLPESLLSCWNGKEWSIQEEDFILLPRGLIASGTGFWIVGEGASINENSLGDLAYLPFPSESTSNPLRKPDEFPSLNFITEFGSERLFITAVIIHGVDSVVTSRLHVTTSITIITVEDKGLGMTFIAKDTFKYPTGILALENSLLVADFLNNSVSEISLEGEVLNTYPGFEGPMGIKQAPNGDICVAEYVAGHISCYTLEMLRNN